MAFMKDFNGVPYKTCPNCGNILEPENINQYGRCMFCEQLEDVKIGRDLASNDPKTRSDAQYLQIKRRMENDKFFNQPFRDARTKKILVCDECGQPMRGFASPTCENTLCKAYHLPWDKAATYVKLQ